MPKLSPSARKSLATRAEQYHQQLFSPEGSALLAYLTVERGLTAETLRQFQLGAVVVPDDSDYKATWRISIPYLRPKGGPVGLRFRASPDMDGPKYWQASGSELHIFNTDALLEARPTICIAEGEVDCMTAVQAGLVCVGLPGVASWRDHYTTIFAGYEQVFVLADNDDSGQGCAFGESIQKLLPQTVIKPMPEGHDVNSFVKAEGASALRGHLRL